jgi:hypothetical protein
MTHQRFARRAKAWGETRQTNPRCRLYGIEDREPLHFAERTRLGGIGTTGGTDELWQTMSD